MANAQELPSIARLADGGFVIVWQSNLQDGSGWGIYGQRYNAAGTRGREFRVTRPVPCRRYSPPSRALPRAALSSAGRPRIPGDASVLAQRFGANGAKVGGEIVVSATTRGGSSVIALARDAFAVVWDSDRQAGSGLGIHGRVYNAAGTPVGAEFQISPTVLSGSPPKPSVSALPKGGFE